jgi:1-aminocyclopropane-1-carboxylate deaminase/D-cysteine desulfhydrase-like pyridoxal-dependent ACC family enzyme
VDYRLNLPSPTEEILFGGRQFYLKRDELIDPNFSGNKARKFHYYLQNSFPDIKKVISYGSNQSNAMYSLSALCKIRGWEFEYFVDHIPQYLLENPQGNYKRALANGMSIKEGRVDGSTSSDTLFIPEGGRASSSEYGIEILAKEILEWREQMGFGKLNIFLPSGTGTTALYLQKSLYGSDIVVYTTPCVGDESYLIEQFNTLESSRYHPTILNTPKKYHFGKLYREFYEMWSRLQEQTNIEFDMLYDPKGWIVVVDNLDILQEPTLYIHQGGLIGNESMLARYKRRY